MRASVLANIAEWIPLDEAAIQRLDDYVALLQKWNGAYNLVGKSTLAEPWARHILDGAQLIPYVSRETSITDFGAGAGVPGIILALLGYENVHLVESNRKKCLFLENVRRKTGAKFTIHNDRIEALNPWQSDIITCRAFASLEDIFAYGEPFSHTATQYVLLKGADFSREQEITRTMWDFVAQCHPTAVQEEGGQQHGCIAVIEKVRRK